MCSFFVTFPWQQAYIAHVLPTSCFHHYFELRNVPKHTKYLFSFFFHQEVNWSIWDKSNAATERRHQNQDIAF
uniref:Uncharacterized protein n=1 Tax=Anguilla anguilla TaxID=7936 RepID=A0A0E9WFN2_ANGAN